MFAYDLVSLCHVGLLCLFIMFVCCYHYVVNKDEYIHCTGSLDDEITARLAKATAAFGCLRKRLWDDHGIRADTKVQVYRAVVLTTVLYGSETWTLTRQET